MDSEISKIWEEALRYVAPLPVPSGGETSAASKSSVHTDISTHSLSNNSSNNNSSSITERSQLLSTGHSRHSGHVVCISNNGSKGSAEINTEHIVDLTPNVNQNLIERLFVDSAIEHNSLQHVDSVSIRSANNSSIQDGGQGPVEIINKVAQMQGDFSNPGLTLNDRSPGSSSDSRLTLKHDAVAMLGVSIDDRHDISDALTAGLRMIQQGNELIAKALKLSASNSNKVGESTQMYANLEPISMPSSVESMNISNIEENDAIEEQSVQNQLPFVSQEMLNTQDTCNLSLEDHSILQEHSNDGKQLDSSEPKVKRRRRREKNPDPTPCAPVLPPCRICDEKSSGFHYGANTCEACKGFFRRTLKKKEVSFQCKCSDSEKQAWSQGPFKNGCPACRYERCLKVGMSRNAIKIGRYTLNRKTENIKEVKSLEAMDSVIERAIFSSINGDGAMSGLDSPASGTYLSSLEATRIADASPAFIDSPSCSTTTEYTSDSKSEAHALTVPEIEKIVEEVTEAHRHATVMDPKVLNRSKDAVDKLHRKYLEDYNLKETVFGNLKPLSKDEYKEFFNATGIDIDGRQAALEEALQHFTKKIVKFVEYAKTIPGFNDLSLQDQSSLIKYSRPEQMVVSTYRHILRNTSRDLQVCTTPWGKEIHLQDIARLIPMDVMKARFKFCERLRDLDLSVEEEAILRGIVITFSDRCELDNPEAVQEIQYKLITCLEHLFSRRKDKPKNPLYKILDLLVQFREFSEMEYKTAKELVFDWPVVSNYALIKDIFL